jgi:hypothetical protein
LTESILLAADLMFRVRSTRNAEPLVVGDGLPRSGFPTIHLRVLFQADSA